MLFSKKDKKEEEPPAVLSINVAEEIKMKDVPPGTPAPTKKEKQEALPPEEVAQRQKVMLEYTRLASRYCEPHTNKSKWVTKEDISRLVSDGNDLVAMCNLPRGKYSGIAALTHTQINNKDPLRFFVLPNGMVIINPIITDHTKALVDKDEACMSYPNRDIKKNIPRYNKITVMYQTLSKDDKDNVILSEVVTQELSGSQAHVFQHKIGHLNGKGSDIFTDDYNPESCIWLGENAINKEELDKLYGKVDNKDKNMGNE